MIDLSEEPIEENIEICKGYERMSKMGMTLEIELGITGGEEDGVDNSDVDSSKLYILNLMKLHLLTKNFQK
jgi:fructose-bisphosphate aldolase class II